MPSSSFAEKKKNITEEGNPELVDPSPDLINKLKVVWKQFSIGFYEAESFSAQAKIVKNFHDVLFLISKQEQKDTIRKSAEVNESVIREEDPASPDRSLKGFKARVAAFQKDISVARKLVKKAQELTKRNLLTGDEIRGQIINFIKRLQDDLKALNRYLMTFKPKEVTETIINEESLDDYKEKIAAIEKAHDAIVKKLGPAIQKIIEGGNVLWVEMKPLAIDTIETLKQITKYFPTMVPFEKGQVANEKLMDEFTDALLGFKVGTAELKALEDLLDGEPNPKLWPSLVSFQQRMVKFSSELQRIFGIEGITGDETLPPTPPTETTDTEDDTDTEESADFSAFIDRTKAKYTGWESSPLFSGLSTDEANTLLAFIGHLLPDETSVVSEAMSPETFKKIFGIDDVKMTERFQKIPEDLRKKALKILSAKKRLTQLKAFIKGEAATSDGDAGEETTPDDREEKKLTTPTEIKTYFNKTLFFGLAASVSQLEKEYGTEFKPRLMQIIMYSLLFKRDKPEPMTTESEEKETSFSQFAKSTVQEKLGISKPQDFYTYLKSKNPKLITFFNKIHDKANTTRSKLLTKMHTGTKGINTFKINIEGLTYNMINKLFEENNSLEGYSTEDGEKKVVLKFLKAIRDLLSETLLKENKQGVFSMFDDTNKSQVERALRDFSEDDYKILLPWLKRNKGNKGLEDLLKAEGDTEEEQSDASPTSGEQSADKDLKTDKARTLRFYEEMIKKSKEHEWNPGRNQDDSTTNKLVAIASAISANNNLFSIVGEKKPRFSFDGIPIKSIQQTAGFITINQRQGDSERRLTSHDDIKKIKHIYMEKETKQERLERALHPFIKQQLRGK